jgi:hypothetical protein
MNGFQIGDKVIICAADDFYAYVYGLRMRVTGFNSGAVEVTGANRDGQELTLFVPSGQLSHTV